MRRLVTRLAFGLAATVVMSMVAPSQAQAAIIGQWGCLAYVNDSCTVVQYCELDTTTRRWFCIDTAGGYQEGGPEPVNNIAQVAPESRPLTAELERSRAKSPASRNLPLSRATPANATG